MRTDICSNSDCMACREHMLSRSREEATCMHNEAKPYFNRGTNPRQSHPLQWPIDLVSEGDRHSIQVRLREFAKRPTFYSAPLLVSGFATAKHRRRLLRSSEVTRIRPRLSVGEESQPRKAFCIFCAAGEHATSHSLGDQGFTAPNQDAIPAVGDVLPKFSELLADTGNCRLRG